MLYQLFMYALVLVSCVVVLHPSINDNILQRLGLAALALGAASEASGGGPNGQLLLIAGLAILAFGTAFKVLSNSDTHT